MTAKRAMDLAGAVLVLLLTSPVLVLSWCAIRLTMGAPVLFRQVRTGINGELFELVKFRTMTDSRGPDGTALPDEQRITPLGRFLRTTSIDELPELWNVLRGDMSLVGPRPLLPEYLPRYSSEQFRRHEVPPGITGLAQVSGRNELDWDDRFALDVRYVEEHSVGLDLRILGRTLAVAVRGGDTGHDGNLTSPEFWGEHDPGDAPAAS